MRRAPWVMERGKLCTLAVAAGLLGCMLWFAARAPAQNAARPQGGNVLTLGGDKDNPFEGTMWRYTEAWQSEAVRTENGEIIRTDPRYPTGGVKYTLTPTKRILGSPLPPEGWQKPEFDDSRWVRRNATITTRYPQANYRSIALMCLRGKFRVLDAAKAQDLNFSLSFEGGAVIYMNGVEVKRAYLPDGKIALDTLAQAYSNQEEKRRRLNVPIPAKLLHTGVNVLAIELHRAPADAARMTGGGEDNRVVFDDIRLTAPAAAPWIEPNHSRPKTIQVWNQDVMSDINFTHYGDPCESVAPIRLSGARNGTYSGEFVVSSASPVTGFKVSAGELKSAGGTIPPSNIQFHYARKWREYWVYDSIAWRLEFDPLDPEAPSDLPVQTVRGMNWDAFQPVWVTVTVPRDAKPGDYSGNVTVAARELPRPVEVPLRIHVSAWTLPDPGQFTTHVSMVESPDSLALQYNVPMWSEEHWKLIDRSFQLLAAVGVKDVYIPVIRRTHFGNEHGMVRFVRQGDGYKCDFSIAARYLDIAVKHLGKVPVVCACVLEPGPYHAQGLAYTEVDPKTRELKEATGPKWGTPGSVALLKPVLEGLQKLCTDRGIKDSFCVGMNDGGGAGPHPDTEVPYKDVEAAWTGTRWLRISHMWNLYKREDAPNHPNWRSVALVSGVVSVFYDPEDDKPVYGWKNPLIMLTYPRTDNMDSAGARLAQNSHLPTYRLAAETSLLYGRRPGYAGRGSIAGQVGRGFQGLRGFGPLGADFFPVLKGERDQKTIIGRYGDSYGQGGWGTVSFNWVTQSVLGPGKTAPIPTARYEMIREGVEEAEARVFVQNAILDEGSRSRLGAALAAKCKAVCDDRTRQFRYLSEFWPCTMAQNGDPIYPDLVVPWVWEDRSQQLYDLAAEVAKALGKKSVQD